MSTNDLAPINVEDLLERCLGQIDFAQEIIEDFLMSSDGSLQNLGKLIEDKDHDLLRIEAHRLKGTAATIGADQLSEKFCSIEKLAAGCLQEDLHVAEVAQQLKDAELEFSKVKDFYQTGFSETARLIKG